MDLISFQPVGRIVAASRRFFDLLGIGSILGGIGSVAGAIGSGSSASAQNRAAEANQRFTNEKLNEGILWQLAAAYGPQRAMEMIRGRLSQSDAERLLGRGAREATLSDEDRRRVEDLNNRIKAIDDGTAGGPRSPGMVGNRGQSRDQQRAALITERDGILGRGGARDAMEGTANLDAINAMGPGYIADYEEIERRGQQGGRDAMAGYDADSSSLISLARSMVEDAQKYGREREETVRGDAADALTEANRAVQSEMLKRGLGGSSAFGEALSGNYLQNQKFLKSALGEIADARMDRTTAARGVVLNTAGARSAGRTAMQVGNLERGINLGLGTAGVKRDAVTGSVMQPWLGRDNQAFFPGASSSGAVLQTLGNSASAVGGKLASYGLMDYLENRGNSTPTPSASTPFEIDWSYSPNSTQNGSNRPR